MPKSKYPLQFPVYIPSKGRAEHFLTMKYLDDMGVPYFVVVEEQEHDAYAAKLGEDCLLVLPMRYKEQYETCDDLGLTKSTGPGPARNFAWDHAIQTGAKWHWVMDDNIQGWFRYHLSEKSFLVTPAGLRSIEDFTLRYENVGMSGPAYESFVARRNAHPFPFVLNSRIYSCNLIRNDLPLRWRGRYNEDTILSIDLLEAYWCTIQFYHVLQNKVTTQKIPGGNTEAFYSLEGTVAKSRLLYEVYPQYVKLVMRYGRPHHYVNYKRYWNKWPRLKRKQGLDLPTEPDNYGLMMREIPRGGRVQGLRTGQRAVRESESE